MKAFKVFALITGILLVIPGTVLSWLLYQHVQATELMWAMWWAITPLQVVVVCVLKISEAAGEEK